MLLALTILLFFVPASNCATQDGPTVRISVIRQQKFRNAGHHPENNRRVVFRMVNDSTKPMIIYGFRYKDGFDPVGYLIVFDSNKRDWAYPTNDNRPIKWSEQAREFKSRYILQPGKRLRFDAEMSELEVGRHFKRTVLVAFEDEQEPREVRSEEFVLK